MKSSSHAWPEWFHRYMESDEIIREIVSEGEKKNATEKQIALAILRMTLDKETHWLKLLWIYKEKYGELEDMKRDKPLNITEITFGEQGVNGSEL